MLVSALTLAAALSLSMGTDSRVPATVAEATPRVAPDQADSRPQFTLGAGDVLGARIRVNDIILARRLDAERVRFATVPTQE